jgi:hypothetical protein
MTEHNPADPNSDTAEATQVETPRLGKPSRSARVLVLSIVFGLLLPGGLLSYGWWNFYYGLTEVKVDPMASKKLLDLKLIDAWESERWEGSVDIMGSGGSGAAIGRYFALEGRDPDQVLNELAQYAQEHGWEGELIPERPNLWIGTKSNLLYDLQLTISYEYSKYAIDYREDAIKVTVSSDMAESLSRYSCCGR